MDLFRLDGKTALITGASRGIGRAIALRMAEAGANVVVTSRKLDACQAVVDEIKQAGGEATAVACNVSDIAALDDLVEAARAAYDHIDIFVGNAAANPHYGPTIEVSESQFDKIIDTNVKASLWILKQLLPAMAERNDGAVILIGSVSGERGTDDIGIYGLSKAATSSLARSLALGWGKHNIRVNCIAPGVVRTDFARALWEDPKNRARIEKNYPLGRIGEPDDIAGLAVCLAAKAGAFITGQTIIVDGGGTVGNPRL